MEISNLTKKRIKEHMDAGKRFDGRDLLDHRELEIETGISINAEGSARVRLGNTEVVAGIKMGVSEPYTDHEGEGTMITTMELLPLSSEEFDYGPPKINAIEIARIVDRGIRESGMIDFKKLCIKKKEKVVHGELTAKKLPITNAIPLTFTFHKIGKSIILDPSREEEASSEAR